MTLVAQDVADVSYNDDNKDIDIAEEAPDGECYFEEPRVVAPMRTMMKQKSALSGAMATTR